MKLLAIIENCFWELVDRKLFWFCLVATVLFSMSFLVFGFKKKEQVDHRKKVEEMIQKVVRTTTAPLDENIRHPDQKTAKLTFKTRRPAFAYYFTPQQIEEYASYAGLKGVKVKGTPQLTVQMGDSKQNVSIPRTIWDKYSVDVRRKKRIRTVLRDRLDRFVPTEIVNRFDGKAREFLDTLNNSEGKILDREIIISTTLVHDNSVDLNKVPGIAKLDILFGSYDIPLRQNLNDVVLVQIQRPLINYVVGWIGIIIAIVLTSNFIPSMVKEGQIDLMLSKSVPRWLVFLGRVLGASLFFALLAGIFLSLSSLFLYLRSGIFTGFLLLSFIPLMLTFFLVYVVSAFIGVLFENNILAMLGAFAVWFFMFLIEQSYTLSSAMKQLYSKNEEAGTLYHTLEVANRIVPAPDKIEAITWKWLANAGILSEWTLNTSMKTEMEVLENISIQNTILTSVGFIALVFGLSLLSFYNKEF